MEHTQSSQDKVAQLEALVAVLSKGKYQWESTFDAIMDPMMIINATYEIERANLAMARSCGQSVQSIIGKKCFEVFAKRKAACERCPLQSPNGHVQNLGAFADGREFVACAYKLDDLGMSVISYQDITKLKELEERLIQSEKMAAIGLLASSIAHEINNPLGGILAFAQMAKKDASANSQTFQDLTEIEKSALSCKRIIEDLLCFSRPAAKMEKRPVNIENVLQQVIVLVRTQWKAQAYPIAIKLDPAALEVLGDEQRLVQIFLNLITNALQASNEGQAIAISSKIYQQQVVIEIQDQGVGIAPENIAKVFDPYFTTKDYGKGTGLGLAITYQLVSSHDGYIEVQSKLGAGSLFKVYLPRCL